MSTRSTFLALAALTVCCSRKEPAQQPPLEKHPPPPKTPVGRLPVGPSTPRAGWPPARPGYSSPIPAENALPGDSDYFDGREAENGEVQGYASRVSAHAGQTMQVMLSTDTPHHVQWSLYRLGWYGGVLARKVLSGATIAVENQGACSEVPSTGLVQCQWAPSFSFEVQPSFVSGLYLLKFARDDGYTSFAPLVVTDDRPADLLLQASVDTYQAYNGWQGESLYEDESGLVMGGLGVQVSFDRPYATDRGSGQVLRYEALFAAFLEQYGYDVAYTSNLDVSAGGTPYIAARGAFLTVGHDEYWSGEERDAVQSARDDGVPVLFFGANQGYWKIRYEQAADPTNPRVITCYKVDPLLDPVQTGDTTGEFRNAPINEPENALVGTMYESYEDVSGAWTVADGSSFLYAGTGLQLGDQMPFLVGYEYDRTSNNGAEPANVDIVAHSPVVNAYGLPSWSDAVTYFGPQGNLVFGAGSIEWSYGLGTPVVLGEPGVTDPRLKRMTANLLQAALNLPIPAGLTSISAPPAPVIDRTNGATSVQTVASGFVGPTAVAALPDGTFYVLDAQANQLFQAGPTASDPVTVVAGDGQSSDKAEYDNVPGAAARFNYPTGLVLLASGDLVVADTQNDCLRSVTADASHTVSTVAGVMGEAGNQDGVGAQARFHDPMGLSVDPNTGDLLVADTNNYRIRRVNTQTWQVTTEAGTTSGDADGPALTGLRMGAPTAVVETLDGRLFVVESSDSRLIAIGADPSRTSVTIAGGTAGREDGPGNAATLGAQQGLLWDGTALYVSDPATSRIRRVTPGATASTTTVETWAGSGVFGGADGPAAQAGLASPLGLSMTADGNVIVANGGNGTVRKVCF